MLAPKEDLWNHVRRDLGVELIDGGSVVIRYRAAEHDNGYVRYCCTRSERQHQKHRPHTPHGEAETKQSIPCTSSLFV